MLRSGNTWLQVQGFLAQEQFTASLFSSLVSNSGCSSQGCFLLSEGTDRSTSRGSPAVTKAWVAPGEKMTQRPGWKPCLETLPCAALGGGWERKRRKGEGWPRLVGTEGAVQARTVLLWHQCCGQVARGLEPSLQPWHCLFQ